MIAVSAMYPLYKRPKMSLVVMTGVAAMANGVMNTLPWGGPTSPTLGFARAQGPPPPPPR